MEKLLNLQIVRWFNMRKESYISEAQWDRYRRITRPCKDELIAPNWRPLQENVNPVFTCKGRKHKRRPCDGDRDSDDSDDSGDGDNDSDDDSDDNGGNDRR